MTQRPPRSRRSSIGAGDRPAAGRGGWRGTVARVAGIAVTLGAIWSLLSIAIGGFRWAEWVENAFLLVGVPTAPTLFSAALLSLLGSALRRRLRAALIVAVVLETVNLATYVVALAAGPSISRVPGRIESTRMTVIAIAAAVSALVVVLLIASRREFPARLRPGSRRLSLAVLAGGLALATGAGLAIAATFPHGLYGADERVDWALDAALGFSVPGLRHPSLGPGWGHFLVSSFSLLVLLAAVAIALRAANAKEFLGPHDELRLRALLDRYGERDSLGYFATRRDKSVIFAPDGEAAVTYRTLGGVSLASADPVGRTGSWPAAISAWLAEARLHGRSPAVLSASEEGAGAYVAAGLKAVPLGDEAVVEIDRFRLDDRALRQVRQAVRRVDQAGYRIEVRRHAELEPELLAEIARLAEQWRGNAVERGFSMALGRLGDRVDGRCVMVLARDRDGALRGLQSYVPWGTRGLSLELMRRDPASPNGVTEALIVALIRSAPDYGVRRVSLNFAVFRSIFENAERTGAGPLVRIGDGLLGFASRFWQLESLYRANAKYEPQWVPRYVCVDSNLSITRTAIAAASAEGFLPGQRHQLSDSGSEVAVAYEGASMALADAVCRQREQFVRSLPAPAAPGRQTRDRLVKLERLRAAGIDPYPPHVDRDRTIAAVLARHAGLAAGAAGGERVAVCGRVRVLRDFGGLVFAVIEEGGAAIQVMVDAAVAGAGAHSLWRRTVDPGDLVAVQGDVVASRSGELSVLASGWTMAAKCLRPVPAVHAGFRDPEARVRDRALDMIVNHDSVGLLKARSRAVAAVRDRLRDRGFLEVETPILQTVHGGAAARPFRTHINAYDLDLSLRIAPELYLKRLAVGGMEAIFELGRNFRNEGADATHNPEFTSLEAYQAHGDYSSMRELARELIVAAAVAVHGEPVALRPDARGGQRPVAIGGSWPVVAVHAAVAEAVGAAVTPATGADELRRLCAAHGVAAGGEASAGMLVLALYEGLVEKQTVEPVFYTDFPIEAAPLTRPHRDDPRLAERWDLVAFGMELGTAYSELIDPVDQRRRLTAQSALAAAGDPEAMELDEAFLAALEYGMPPTGGLGIGIDRVVMMLLGATIRGSLAFPFVRPRSEPT